MRALLLQRTCVVLFFTLQRIFCICWITVLYAMIFQIEKYDGNLRIYIFTYREYMLCILISCYIYVNYLQLDVNTTRNINISLPLIIVVQSCINVRLLNIIFYYLCIYKASSSLARTSIFSTKLFINTLL